MFTTVKDTYQIHKIVFHSVRVAFAVITLKRSIVRLADLTAKVTDEMRKANQ